MTVKEMCAKYGLVYQTVYKKASRHKDKELAGHITKVKGSPIQLDDYAVEYLLPQYIKNRQVETRSDEIRSKNFELNMNLNNALKELDGARTEIERLKTANAEVNESYTALKADYDSALNTSGYANDEMLRYKKKSEELQAEVYEKNNRCEGLSFQLKDMTEKNESLTADVNNLTDKVKELTETVSERDAEIESLKSEIEVLKTSKKPFAFVIRNNKEDT